MDTQQQFTTTEAAARLKLSRLSVELYLRAGRLHGKKFGNQWMIPLSEIVRYAKERKPSGRPKKESAKI